VYQKVACGASLAVLIWATPVAGEVQGVVALSGGWAFIHELPFCEGNTSFAQLRADALFLDDATVMMGFIGMGYGLTGTIQGCEGYTFQASSVEGGVGLNLTIPAGRVFAGLGPSLQLAPQLQPPMGSWELGTNLGGVFALGVLVNLSQHLVVTSAVRERIQRPAKNRSDIPELGSAAGPEITLGIGYRFTLGP
jgi:hypothetical protein